MYILGISCHYHDAAACLIKDGRVIAAAEEERFTRKKHDNDFPINAINFCLKEAGITSNDLAYIGFYEKPMLKIERVLETAIQTYPKSLLSFVIGMPGWMTEKIRIPSLIRKKLKYKGEIFFIKHHLSHAASAFYVSPFREAAILTVDGVGEWTTAAYGFGRDRKITLLKETRFPNSLGLLYSTITAYLGFTVNNDEYKVMGAAAYGKPDYVDKIKGFVKIHNDGSIELDMSYFSYHYSSRMFSRKMEKLLGKARKRGEKIEQRHMDIAASLQAVTEEILFKMVNHVYTETKMKYLCLAGGVALNSLANGKLLKEGPFDDIFIQPAAGDSGGALGVAYYIYHHLKEYPRSYVMNDAYFGPEFSNEEIRAFLEKNAIKYTEMDEKAMIKKVAELLAEDKVIGWFQGRMEWGPRALGNRSILASPLKPEMKDILNMKVKHREEFRPFAPVSTYDDAKAYFETDRELPFMLFVCDVRKEKRKIIPAVTHEDGTARLQTITEKQNRKYYHLIKEFKKKTGVAVLVNTSFNVRGEPIVCTPEEAYKCFAGTEIDYLVMDNFLITKTRGSERVGGIENDKFSIRKGEEK